MIERKRTKGNRTFIGWDTETVDNGQIVLIANSNREYQLLPSIDELLDFLTRYENNRYLNYFFNLDYDIKSLIMTIANSNKQLEDVRTFLETDHLIYKDYTLIYIRGKRLTIMKNARTQTVRYFDEKQNKMVDRSYTKFDKKAIYYDIAQFYLNQYGKQMSLRESAKQYLDISKLDMEDISNIDVERIKTDEVYRRKLLEYCVRDCVLAKKLTYLFYNNIKKVIETRKFLSPAYLSQLYIGRQLKKSGLEQEFTNPFIRRYEELIMLTYYGGRFETFKKGTPNKELYLYDINSAYPTFLSQVRGFAKQATITHNNEDLELEKCYPIINIDIDYSNNYMNPLPFKSDRDNKLVFFPSVRRKMNKWITHFDLELLDMMKIDYNINKIIHFWTTDNLLFDFIHELYELKKDGDYKKAVKIILNSMYGKTVEKTKRHMLTNDWENADKEIIINGWVYFIKTLKDVRGRWYNPLIGTETTAFCRNMVVKPLIQQQLQNNLYQIATDSILLDRKIDLPLSKNLGEWGLDSITNPTIYGNGIIDYDEKFNGKGELIDKGFKSRGFSCGSREDFLRVVKSEKYKKQQVIPMNHYRKWGFDRIHSFQRIEKNFSIVDKKRRFPEVVPIKLKETLIDSKPLFWN